MTHTKEQLTEHILDTYSKRSRTLFIVRNVVFGVLIGIAMLLSIWLLAGFLVDIYRMYQIYQIKDGVPLVLLQYALYELLVLVILCILLIAVILRQTDWNMSYNMLLIIAAIVIFVICFAALLVSVQTIREQFTQPLHVLEQSKLRQNRRKELDKKLPPQRGGPLSQTLKLI